VRIHRIAVLSLALAALLSGCGNSTNATNVTTPELDGTAPSAPSALSLATDPSSFNSSLHWSLSSSSDVSRYEIYMFSPDPSRDNAYVLLGETNATTSNFGLDPVGQTTSNFYRVRAVDGNGNRSGFSSTLSAELRPAPRSGNPASGNTSTNNGTIEP
jgi:hypothetical protein